VAWSSAILLAHFFEAASASAAEVDAVLAEDCGGAEVVGDNGADGACQV
jgi:hypothetical protein